MMLLKYTPIRYSITGILLFVVDLTVFLTLKHFGATTLFSQFVSRSVGASLGFVGHKFFSFCNKKFSMSVIAIQGTGYISCSIFNIFISPFVVLGFEYLIPNNLFLVKFLAEVIMVVETYFILKWIFGSRSIQRGFK